jgi:acetyl esterase/lipase
MLAPTEHPSGGKVSSIFGLFEHLAEILLTDLGCRRTLPPVNSTRHSSSRWIVILIPALIGITTPALSAELPEERLLWPEANFDNPIQYGDGEQVRTNGPIQGSPSGMNRVYGFVSNPTYSIHQAPGDIANGVGLVICPGGGYREVWLDREGHDLALWLKARGVTSLVLKYRTNSAKHGGEGQYPWDVYLPAVFADARQAIRLLRSQAAELKLDLNKIGICGFSAGGNLAFNAVFRPEPDSSPNQISGEPDFAGLLYPWFRENFGEMVTSKERIPPLFIMNAIDDRLTPVARCLDFYQTVLKAGAQAELHLFSKGGHGFDLGEGRGESAAIWKESFVAWLEDSGFIR